MLLSLLDMVFQSMTNPTVVSWLKKCLDYTHAKTLYLLVSESCNPAHKPRPDLGQRVLLRLYRRWRCSLDVKASPMDSGESRAKLEVRKCDIYIYRYV